MVGTAWKVLSCMELDEEDVLNIVDGGEAFDMGEEAALGTALDEPLPSVEVEEPSEHVQKEPGDPESPNSGSSPKVSGDDGSSNLEASTEKATPAAEASTARGKRRKKRAPTPKTKVYPHVIYALPARRTFLKRSAD